jgi:hypothetical protein
MRTGSALLLSLILVGCGGSGGAPEEPATATPAAAAAPAATSPEGEPDRAARCATFATRSRPVVEEMAANAGKPFGPEQERELRSQCEKGGSGDEILLDCVAAAADTPAVKTCWSEAMERYLDASRR